MNVLEKVKVLADASKFDSCASSASNRKVKTNDRIGNAAGCGICHSFTEDGRCISLYKTLFSNACSHDCKYCQNASGCNKKPASFKPDELAKTFMSLYVRNYVEGLFLSSAVVKDADSTTEQMIEAINLIRSKYKFQGYIHFKVLPGTSYELIKQASEFADRMSVNLEAPNKSRLSEISSVKDFKIDILRRQAWLKRMKIPSGQTTQLVVGGSDETDLEILRMIDWEYKNIKLKRGYYSAFMPVENTPLAGKKKQPLLREHRLYNIDFMMRKYYIKLNEFKDIMDDGMLPKEDPKIALARRYFDGPVDVNEAGWDDLIRVPGIGPRNAKRILELQESGSIISKKHLHNMGVVLKRAIPFIKIDGYHQKMLGEFVS
ncbi:putative DNA modification/repair radical SAM protein [Candidatus Woesearchaeota archaeon]|nr:putative DNA modification/repair radical SAM protein [Candidatus Woesearchaeota archaeon]